MSVQLSRMAVTEYLPLIKRIYAGFEVEMRHDKNFENAQILRLDFLEKEFGASKVHFAMMVIGVWLQGTQFAESYLAIYKKDPLAEWSEMVEVIHAKILEYHNDVPVIVLTLSGTGRIIREINGEILTHEFKEDGFKADILRRLPQDGDYLNTGLLKEAVGSKNRESVSKIIGATNKALTKKLQLPAGKNLIDSKSGSGYRIHPIYNIVKVK